MPRALLWHSRSVTMVTHSGCWEGGGRFLKTPFSSSPSRWEPQTALCLSFCFHWMLVVRATEIHSEYKKRGQSVVVRILTDWNWTTSCKTLEINTAPGISYSLSQRRHYLFSFHGSSFLSVSPPFSFLSSAAFVSSMFPTPLNATPPWPPLTLIYPEQPPSHHLNIFVTIS